MTAVLLNAMVLWLLFHHLMISPFFFFDVVVCFVLVGLFGRCVVLSVSSSFTIISLGTESWLLYFTCQLMSFDAI